LPGEGDGLGDGDGLREGLCRELGSIVAAPGAACANSVNPEVFVENTVAANVAKMNARFKMEKIFMTTTPLEPMVRIYLCRN
jgi:hypothetical protein